MSKMQALISAVDASLDTNKKEQLTGLLWDHRDIFAMNRKSPSQTDLVQHDIAEDMLRIKQWVRWSPIQNEQAQAEIKPDAGQRHHQTL